MRLRQSLGRRLVKSTHSLIPRPYPSHAGGASGLAMRLSHTQRRTLTAVVGFMAEIGRIKHNVIQWLLDNGNATHP